MQFTLNLQVNHCSGYLDPFYNLRKFPGSQGTSERPLGGTGNSPVLRSVLLVVQLNAQGTV